jgi:Histidine kinase-, DNA gyrase B-, and HSP90-like ATPase
VRAASPRLPTKSALEGPYRDLGSGFARLTGAEGARRSASNLRSIEDALFELLRNSRDAGARNIYVASSSRARRYRTLVVIDDGRGIPETHKHLVFEPGVTTRHLAPVRDSAREDAPHGAGLSLYRIRNAAVLAEVVSASSPTALKVVFDTRVLPEKSLQTTRPGSRPSKTNIPATLTKFARLSTPNPPRLYHASPARTFARLLENHIIQRTNARATTQLRAAALSLGLEVSLRTVQRVVAGKVSAADEVVAEAMDERTSRYVERQNEAAGPILSVGPQDLAQIRAVLRRVARSNYLDLAELSVERRAGEVILRAHVYEPEDEYE